MRALILCLAFSVSAPCLAQGIDKFYVGKSQIKFPDSKASQEGVNLMLIETNPTEIKMEMTFMSSHRSHVRGVVDISLSRASATAAAGVLKLPVPNPLPTAPGTRPPAVGSPPPTVSIPVKLRYDKGVLVEVTGAYKDAKMGIKFSQTLKGDELTIHSERLDAKGKLQSTHVMQFTESSAAKFNGIRDKILK